MVNRISHTQRTKQWILRGKGGGRNWEPGTDVYTRLGMK